MTEHRDAARSDADADTPRDAQSHPGAAAYPLDDESAAHRADTAASADPSFAPIDPGERYRANYHNAFSATATPDSADSASTASTADDSAEYASAAWGSNYEPADGPFSWDPSPRDTNIYTATPAAGTSAAADLSATDDTNYAAISPSADEQARPERVGPNRRTRSAAKKTKKKRRLFGKRGATPATQGTATSTDEATTAAPATTDEATAVYEPARPGPSRDTTAARHNPHALRSGDLLDGTHDEYAVLARGLSVVGSEGPVYGPIDVAVPADGVTVLSGRGGSGRTALALTIAGRMKPSEGELIVLGMTKRRDIRRHVAIAGVDQIDLLDRDLTVRQVLNEHRCWGRRFFQPPLKIDEDYLVDLAEPIYGTRTLPPLDAYISQLPGLDRHLLRIAMALRPSHHEPVGLLIVDDLEQIHELDERVVLISRLVELSRQLPVVINAVNFLPHTLVPPERQVRLDADSSHISPYDWGIEDDELDEIVKEYAK
ncbi:hypothetical protein KRX51_08915 [Corynebacterium sp. TAE3-ERU12]|uniref:ATP-binding cassette domain-containing protein n=1 Tax=Corynebacterium sp. TAE3-ERU12 TaxID=2849491 RepID=UPI001C47F913|nr:ATP-binding cassette domain-containing protein [Corynebacterium sp. TAE3-ERU12]MBV7296029.1 hypothetical protein [Corynebacterium sp. TAE3-ERU12]